MANPGTPAYGGSFTFSPLNDQPTYQLEEQKDTKANVLEEASMMAEPSQKLRILLESNESRDRILKELLNRKDDDKSDSRSSPRGGGINRPNLPGSLEPPKTTTSSGGSNNMLLQVSNISLIYIWQIFVKFF